VGSLLQAGAELLVPGLRNVRGFMEKLQDASGSRVGQLTTNLIIKNIIYKIILAV
jgi:hypothetical protein